MESKLSINITTCIALKLDSMYESVARHSLCSSAQLNANAALSSVIRLLRHLAVLRLTQIVVVPVCPSLKQIFCSGFQ